MIAITNSLEQLGNIFAEPIRLLMKYLKTGQTIVHINRQEKSEGATMNNRMEKMSGQSTPEAIVVLGWALGSLPIK